MQAFFLDLFEYNDYSNNKIIAVLNENPIVVSANCVRLMSHVLNAHRIWNDRIQPVERRYERWETHLPSELAEINAKNHSDSLAILHLFELDREIEYQLSTGQPFKNSIRNILFQVINHSTYHRGQIATEFRRTGLEPIQTEFIMFRMK